MTNIRKGKSLCIYSPKGGTGKTILAMNLAGIASLKDKKVLLVDYDMFNGGLCMLLDEEINKTVYNFTDDIANNRIKDFNEYIYKYNDNIDILCSPKDPRQGGKVNPKYLEIILDKTRSRYDLTIIDTSSVLDEINLFTLDKVDNILFIVTNDMFCIKNLRNIINIFNDNGFNNYKVLYNTSFDPKEIYYSFSDVEKLIDSKINYCLDKSFFMKHISSYLFDSKIPALVNEKVKKYKNGIKCLNSILDDLLLEVEDAEKK